MFSLNREIWSALPNSNSEQSRSNQTSTSTLETLEWIPQNQFKKQLLGHPETKYPAGSPNDKLIQGYLELLSSKARQGWSFYFTALMFKPLSGSRSAIALQMQDQIQRLYSHLVTRTYRKPRKAAADTLPVFIGCIDRPVYKRDKSLASFFSTNAGLHVHIIIALPPHTRLKQPLPEHIEQNQKLYLGATIERIHIEPVYDLSPQLVDYTLKSILNRRLSYDEAMIVLPRSRAELN